MSEKIKGKIKWFNADKGYGFISIEDGEDIYVHQSAIQGFGFRRPEEGQVVEFTFERGQKGLRAIDVVFLGLPGDSDTDAPPPEIFTGE